MPNHTACATPAATPMEPMTHHLVVPGAGRGRVVRDGIRKSWRSGARGSPGRATSRGVRGWLPGQSPSSVTWPTRREGARRRQRPGPPRRSMYPARSETTGSHVAQGMRLMAVHAHPDDESSKGAATTARYVAAGTSVMVVSCTGGERGDILNEKLKDDPHILRDIAQVRRDEMKAAQEVLGCEHTWLGFVDSGLPEGDPLPPLPDGC